MNKIINGSNKYLLIIEMLVVISIVLSITYSNYFVESSNHRAAEMYIGSLKYSMKIDSNETNTLSLKPGVTVIDVDVNNLNPVDTYYKLLYLNNSNLEIKYFSPMHDEKVPKADILVKQKILMKLKQVIKVLMIVLQVVILII